MNNFKLWSIIFLTLFFGCKFQSDKQKSSAVETRNDCHPYFTYNKVEHYYFDITDKTLWDIFDKKDKTVNEKTLIELIVRSTPDTLTDTTLLRDIEKIGFTKQVIPELKFEQLDMIFCERTKENAILHACKPVYRDIIVFKQNDKIVGTAKICFKCSHNILAGAYSNTRIAPTLTYETLYRLLH